MKTIHPASPTSLDPIGVVFTTAQTSVTIQALGAGANGAQIVAFDAAAGGNQVAIDQVIHSGYGSENLDTLFVNAPIIRRVELSQAVNAFFDDGMAWDNLDFVPEPTTLTLAVLGLMGWVGMRRRRVR